MTAPSDTPLGTLYRRDGTGVVRFEITVPAGTEETWSALTEPGRLADWLGRVEGDLREGGTFSGFFRVSEWDGTGRIAACEPGRRFTVLMSEHAATTEASTDVELSPVDSGTRLEVTQLGHPLPQLAAYGAGLQVHVEDLVGHLSGRPGRNTADRFGALWPGYQALAVLDD